jgi:hypothetical protein
MDTRTNNNIESKFVFFVFFGRIHFREFFFFFRNFSMKTKMKEIYVFVYEYTFYFEDKKNPSP